MRLHTIGQARGLTARVLGRVTKGQVSPCSRGDAVLLWGEGNAPQDTAGYVAVLTARHAPAWELEAPLVHSVQGLEYLTDGDVVVVAPNGFVRTLYRKGSYHNFILIAD